MRLLQKSQRVKLFKDGRQIMKRTDYSLMRLLSFACIFFTFGMQTIRAADSPSPQKIKGITFVSIPGGDFQMGDEDNRLFHDCRPVHTVTLASFQMSDAEITNAQYCEFLNVELNRGEISVSDINVTGTKGKWSKQEYFLLSGNFDSKNRCWISFKNNKFSVTPGYENWPVVYVTWFGAKAFAEFYELDLPREAEWEYASRGGVKNMYGTDDGTIGETKANYENGGPGSPMNVRSYPKNPFGLYDMSGNVWEWCDDWYGKYGEESLENPAGPGTGTEKVFRGGGWSFNVKACRSAIRGLGNPGIRYPYLGFRVVRR
jgi:formylglycine-generating enzyme